MVRLQSLVVAGLENGSDSRTATRETRTSDLSFTKAPGDSVSGEESNICGGDSTDTSSSPGSRGGNPALDDHLRGLIDAWPTLPEPMRAGILAMVEAAAKDNAR